MGFRVAEARRELQAFDLKKLFIEQMGWDNPDADITIRFNGQSLKLKAIAQKRGLGAYVVPPIDGKIPDYATRRRIEAEVRKIKQEHILIFTSADGSTLRWQWVRREPNKPTTAREYEYTRGQSGEALLQRLEKMYFSFEDEEKLSGITDATSRVRSAFDVERVTRRFYDRFKEEHADFMKFVKGIPDKELQRWYVSVTLNRLMFVYFIQSKHFLNDDPSYLKNHLAASKEKGEDLFYSDFLCPLFFEGFAKKERTAKVKRLFGNIPYLNGGIFEQHEIEEQYGEKIHIPDRAFEQLFEFFDEYRWHLDERPNKDDKEINPDVLGYIFEKYINQKQMGAYYTKEDITEYISKNTIIPHLFDVAQKECRIAFEGEGSVWRHLQDDPDRYIYPAVRFGIENPLPAEIAVGVNNPKRREGWNKSAPAEFALPTEIWREVVARRRRYQEVRDKLAGGEVRSINDLITLNLDIRQFAQDVIEDSDADLLGAFWKAITQIKILDPTVGSGAFLFAALNILEPLYEACIERMSLLVQELDSSGEKHSPKKYEPFRKALEQVRQRPDEDYFIFKSIIINNLYGVDIMEEAVEICKLRLFLKLASQVEPDPSKENLGIEPLPDIDFNIRAGNTLVGFATREDVKRSVKLGMTGGKQKVEAEKLFAMPEEDEQLGRIEEQAAAVDRLYKFFRQQQTEYGGEVNAEDKKKLEEKLKALDNELNILLARQYAIHNPRGEAYKKWLETHKPFHWFVEFYGIMRDGGFDVIIGNPPYVEYNAVKSEYTVLEQKLMTGGNLHSMIFRRCIDMCTSQGSLGMIVPVAVTGTDRMQEIRHTLINNSQAWVSTYDIRPSKLFVGAEQRLSIILARKQKATAKSKTLNTTKYIRWNSVERHVLFEKIYYFNWNVEPLPRDVWPKLGSALELSIIRKIQNQEAAINHLLGEISSPNTTLFYKNTGIRYFTIFTTRAPICYINGRRESSSRETELIIRDANSPPAIHTLLNSSLFFWMYQQLSNCRDLNPSDIGTFRVPNALLQDPVFVSLSKKLQDSLEENSWFQVRNQKQTGEVKIQSFTPSLSKSIIDEIDRALAPHYGLSDEELDFIINYDVKYRMGAELEGEE
jgi:tRNA1(Val) A37 N6-methylase TrmN6